jgi:cell wall-associated NlpC family hydrolase
MSANALVRAEAQPPSADRRRLAAVEHARAWLRTPYHHMGRVQGGGTDCLMLLVEVYQAAGIIRHIDVPFYPPDWNLHRSAERYLDGLMCFAHEVAGPPQLGDVALFKFGRCFAHGAIVVSWPRLIHAWWDAGVVYGDAHQPPLAGRAVRFFDPFAAAGR